MNRRQLLQAAAAAPVLAGLPAALHAAPASTAFQRVRPGEPGWPSADQWAQLGRAVGGRLVKVSAPMEAVPRCACGSGLRRAVRGGEEPVLPRRHDRPDADARLGRRLDLDAQRLRGGRAQTTADVVAAVNFAREHRLRLVVKGGGHSYQGTSNAPDSLLVWTREDERRSRCTTRSSPRAARAQAEAARGRSASAPARSGRMSTTPSRTQAGGYVQGGGCMTVGVAGLVQSGGFGSFSKAYGLAAGEPARGRGRHRRRRRAHRQRVHEPRAVLGPQGRRRRQPGRRHAAHAAGSRAARDLRRREHDDQGDIGARVSPADRPDRRLLRAQPDESALGRTDPLASATTS